MTIKQNNRSGGHAHNYTLCTNHRLMWLLLCAFELFPHISLPCSLSCILLRWLRQTNKVKSVFELLSQHFFPVSPCAKFLRMLVITTTQTRTTQLESRIFVMSSKFFRMIMIINNIHNKWFNRMWFAHISMSLIEICSPHLNANNFFFKSQFVISGSQRKITGKYTREKKPKQN